MNDSKSMNKNAEIMLDVCKEVCLEKDAEETRYKNVHVSSPECRTEPLILNPSET